MALELKTREGVLVAKIYLSPDERKLRIVFPELKRMIQVKIDLDHHLIDFTRDIHTAEEEVKRPWKP